MKKSLKRFLIISQVLGWSALLASACTDEQINNISQTINTNNQNTSTESGSADTNSATEHKQDTTDSNNQQMDQNETGSPSKPNGGMDGKEKEKKTTEAKQERPSNDKSESGSLKKPEAGDKGKSGMGTQNNPSSHSMPNKNPEMADHGTELKSESKDDPAAPEDKENVVNNDDGSTGKGRTKKEQPVKSTSPGTSNQEAPGTVPGSKPEGVQPEPQPSTSVHPKPVISKSTNH